VSASSSLCKGKKKILPNQTFFQNGCKKLSAELLEKSATPMTGIALNHYISESLALTPQQQPGRRLTNTDYQ
jgi:hypothetical protein